MANPTTLGSGCRTGISILEIFAEAQHFGRGQLSDFDYAFNRVEHAREQKRDWKRANQKKCSQYEKTRRRSPKARLAHAMSCEKWKRKQKPPAHKCSLCGQLGHHKSSWRHK